MNFAEFAASRKSVRGFKKRAVLRQLVDAVINAAKWAPSSYNTQTWGVQAVTGEVLDKIPEEKTKKSAWNGGCEDFANLTHRYLSF